MNTLVDRIIVSAWILLASGAGMVLYVDRNAAPSADGGGLGIQVVYSVLYILFFALLIANYNRLIPLLIQEKWIVILWLWALASTSWSILPDTTLRRCIGLLGTTAAGLFVAVKFEPKQQIRIVTYCLGFSAVLSLLVCLLAPSYGIAPTREWTGVFYQKNALGHAMELAIFGYVFLALGRQRGRFALLFMALVCGVMLVMSKSVTAVMVCALMLMFLRFRKLLILQGRKLLGYGAALATVGVPAGIYAFRHMDSVLALVGRDATLTGRMPLWQEVLREIATRPWQGFGYSAFWFSSEGALIQLKLNWIMLHSHSGYLETTLGLGLTGTILLIIGITTGILRGARTAARAETIYDLWPIFYLIFAVLDNLAEAWFLTANSLVWMLFVANSYWLVRKCLQPAAVTEENKIASESELALGTAAGMQPVGS